MAEKASSQLKKGAIRRLFLKGEILSIRLTYRNVSLCKAWHFFGQ